MNGNEGLATFSDVAFATTAGIYLVALVISLVYYGMLRSATDARRERARILGESKAKADTASKVSVGAGGWCVRHRGHRRHHRH